MWQNIASQSSYIPIILPVGFFILNASVKWSFSHLNLHYVGSDVALCGCSLFAGVAIRQISVNNLQSNEAAAAVVLLLVVLGVWLLCAFLAKHQRIGYSLASAMLGCVSMWFCSLATWSILR